MSKATFQGLFNAAVNKNYAWVLPVKQMLYDLAGHVYDRKVKPVVVITEATTLTIDDSDKVFSLQAAAGAQITLPAVATSAGFHAKFVVGLAFANTAWTIKAASNKIQGGAVVNSTWVPGADENTITFAHAAETIGDFIDLDCDGTNWYANGVAAAAGGITFTAP